jgi:hypothetical protein
MLHRGTSGAFAPSCMSFAARAFHSRACLPPSSPLRRAVMTGSSRGENAKSSPTKIELQRYASPVTGRLRQPPAKSVAQRTSEAASSSPGWSMRTPIWISATRGRVPPTHEASSGMRWRSFVAIARWTPEDLYRRAGFGLRGQGRVAAGPAKVPLQTVGEVSVADRRFVPRC